MTRPALQYHYQNQYEENCLVIGTAADVQDNDVVGTINWFADDGTDTSKVYCN